jgi:hypothetical protein
VGWRSAGLGELTGNPFCTWMCRHGWSEPPRYIIRDRDGAYGEAFIRRLGHNRPISARSPWQNGLAERRIGSNRRECLDHVVIFGDAPIAEEGRSDSTRRPERRARACLANLGRSSPSVRSSLNIRQGVQRR